MSIFYVKIKNNTDADNTDVKNLTDNKEFWKNIRPKFPNKCKTANTIILVEDEKILQGEKSIANTFNNYFADAMFSLNNYFSWLNEEK